jgi:ankyrin repeat protein
MTNSDTAREEMHGVMYWGCESAFHMTCIEADQKGYVSWSTVLDFIESSRSKKSLKEQAQTQEGDMKLTPLAIVASEGPPHVVQAVLDLAPDATEICDRFNELPLHRAALQHRLKGSNEVMKILRDADPQALTKLDKYGRTPLHCAIDSRRGPASVSSIKVLMGSGQPLGIKDKQGKTPLDRAQEVADISPVVIEMLKVAQ